MNVRLKVLLSLTGLVMLAGCDNGYSPAGNNLAAEPDIVSVKLAQAADKASNALDTIAGIEQQRSPATPPLEDYTGAPANLMQPVSIRWSGPIDQIARQLAEHAGMRFRVKGRTPPVPLTVTVDSYQKPILHVLRDIGLQAGHRADLAVDPNGGVVELRYAPSDQSVPTLTSATINANEIK
ncbi:MAG TPA: DotD/TraH family lipoprotein [Alphaproteobacteria bacterium]|nr:DotD/TraH family lipoprotein [Alphaproteobacteria bacterium]